MNVIIVTDRTIYATWLSKCFQYSSIVRTDSQGPLNFFCDGLVTFQSPSHYNDVIMGAMVSQITSLTIVYSIQTQIKENTKAPRRWPLCGEFTGDRGIPRTNGQLRGKCFHLMTSSWQWSNVDPSYTTKCCHQGWLSWFNYIYPSNYCGRVNDDKSVLMLWLCSAWAIMHFRNQ